MDQILEQARSIYEGEIDFQGQRLAELLQNLLLSISGVIAFLVGFTTQNIIHSLYIGLGGTALTFLIVVPPWPWYNQKAEAFLPPKKHKAASTDRRDLKGIDVQGLKLG
ncbi:microsomal signal peptidase 12 kDa subunit-domain-containing protein [Neohortaea acidophila]|uniref:Signal peptidase complex subunit 1 n=1 Tax=Neohortaea acidophila TaxID=245834 RepID=A0A6A6PXI7_9PEZI|nr:microsomal signal peptidase 12 kDa subunit-domain-containing protein [Neohortaea acidophila]KAF2484476.1 microsomal signal peptidase 12 kDa subunit-domain-containing protein [Neohortaea acidophila]